MPVVKKKVKRKIRKRATKQANQAAKPARQALRRQERRLRQDFRQEVGASEGAAQALSDAISMAQGDLKGLKGRYKKQAIKELASRKVDAAATVPFERAALRQDYLNASRDLADQRANLEAETAASATELYQQKVSARRKAALEKQEKQDKARSGRRNAQITAKELLEKAKERASAPVDKAEYKGLKPDARKEAIFRAKKAKAASQAFIRAFSRGDKAAIRTFALQVADKAEGTDEREALRVVRAFYERAYGRKPTYDFGPGGIRTNPPAIRKPRR